MLKAAKIISGTGFLLLVLLLLGLYVPAVGVLLPIWMMWLILPMQLFGLVANVVVLVKEELLGWKLFSGIYILGILLLLLLVLPYFFA